MATTTTNYGFDVPTSSDLVKNGATAISTLGQDIDTFLFRPFTRNGAINGAQDIWQRGTSISTSVSIAYASDRWQSFTNNAGLTGTTSRQSSGLTGIQYCARVQRTAGNTNANTLIFNSSFESANSYQFAGQTVTLSFYARAGANYSSASSALAYYLFSGTGTDQNVNSGFTGQATVTSGASTLTTSWQRFSYTGTVSASATQLAIWFQYTASGTAGANDYFEITGIQLEVGSQVSPFTRAGGGSIQQELAACMRYFQTNGDYNYFGAFFTTTAARFYYTMPVTMRVTPTPSFPSGPFTNNVDIVGVGSATPTAVANNTANTKSFSFDASGMSGGVTSVAAVWRGSAITLSSEL